jgi:hypothetical protein
VKQNVTVISERFAWKNHNNMVWNVLLLICYFHHIEFLICYNFFFIDHVLFILIEYASNKHCISLSFSAIFSQAIKMLGCRWHTEGFDHTSLDDKWRDHVKFHTEPYSTTVFTINEKSN